MPNGGSGPQVVVPGGGWVDVASRAIVQVGFPVVVAAWLLWYVLGNFRQDMTAIVERMGNNTAIVKELTVAQQATVEELKRQTAALEKIVTYSDKLMVIQEERQRLMKDQAGAQR